MRINIKHHDQRFIGGSWSQYDTYWEDGTVYFHFCEKEDKAGHTQELATDVPMEYAVKMAEKAVKMEPYDVNRLFLEI